MDKDSESAEEWHVGEKSFANLSCKDCRYLFKMNSVQTLLWCNCELSSCTGRVRSGGVRGHQSFDMQALGGPQLTAYFLPRSKHFPARKLLCDWPGFCNPHHTKVSLEVPQELRLSHRVSIILLLFITFPKMWVSAHPENYLRAYTQDPLWKMHLPLYASRHVAEHFLNQFSQVRCLLYVSLVSWCVQPSCWHLTETCILVISEMHE